MPIRRSAGLVLLFVGLVPMAPTRAAAQTTTSSYFEFLMARRLEAEGDVEGALAALQRAASADPMSASIQAEIAGVQFRENRRDEAEKAAQAALAAFRHPDVVVRESAAWGRRTYGVVHREGAEQVPATAALLEELGCPRWGSNPD